MTKVQRKVLRIGRHGRHLGEVKLHQHTLCKERTKTLRVDPKIFHKIARPAKSVLRIEHYRMPWISLLSGNGVGSLLTSGIIALTVASMYFNTYFNSKIAFV